jgi:hypothetical protein
MYTAPDPESVDIDAFQDQSPSARACRIDWPPAFGIANLEGGPGEVLALGHRGYQSGLGSTAIEITRRSRCPMLVAQAP